MKKILTIILDGFGMKEEDMGNAVKLAHMNTFTNLWNKYPHSYLEASEEAVGLMPNQAGNSEVGHMTIGAGRLLKQNEILVNEFLDKPDLENKNVIKLLNNKDKDVHIMGLCSDGNIHAGVDDFLNMFKFLVENGFTKIHFHLITDGRDTGIYDASKYIKMIEDAINIYKVGDISTVCGRFYAMDRDDNWQRTRAYYELVVNGKGINSLDIYKTIESSYKAGISDEFIKPIYLNNALIKDGDVLIWMNYRADRAKQIISSFVNWSDFQEFPVKNMNNLEVYSFFTIDKKIKTNNLIEHVEVKNSLGLYLSELNFTQARIAESEKFPHVTYFFDGGVDGKIKGCDKFHIPSPHVETYDLKPEMSCIDVAKRVILSMNNDYDFILVNFANPDMVGHTGNLDATIKACMAIDLVLNKIMEKAEENFYKVVILADHGNADTMINEDGSPCTTHTTALVPFIICDEKVKLKEKGTLVNVAPTILDYMDIAIPKEMEETESLLLNE